MTCGIWLGKTRVAQATSSQNSSRTETSAVDTWAHTSVSNQLAAPRLLAKAGSRGSSKVQRRPESDLCFLPLKQCHAWLQAGLRRMPTWPAWTNSHCSHVQCRKPVPGCNLVLREVGAHSETTVISHPRWAARCTKFSSLSGFDFSILTDPIRAWPGIASTRIWGPKCCSSAWRVAMCCSRWNWFQSILRRCALWRLALSSWCRRCLSHRRLLRKLCDCKWETGKNWSFTGWACKKETVWESLGLKLLPLRHV